MGWVRIDDNAPDHRKQLAAGAAACWLWVCGLAYCRRQTAQDGFIPAAKVPVLYPVPNAKTLAAKLVEVGLWEVSEGGYRVHDYHHFNPTAEAVEAKRAAIQAVRAEAGRLGGKQSGAARRAREVAPVEAKPKQTEPDDDEAKPEQDEANSKQTSEANAKPHPIPSHPIPDGTQIPLIGAERLERAPRRTRAAKVEPAEPPGYAEVVDAYFMAYERAKGAKPVFTSRTGKAAKTLLALMPAEDAIAAILRAFADPWFVEHEGELWEIAAKPNRWRGQPGVTPVRAPSSGKRLIQAYHGPAGGDRQGPIPEANYDFGVSDEDRRTA